MFNEGQIIEALCPRSGCWLKAYYQKPYAEKHLVEWYDAEQRKSFYGIPTLVDEVRALPIETPTEKQYECVACETTLTKQGIWECHSPCGSWSTYRCNACNHKVIEVLPPVREIDLTEPMHLIQSVEVTDEMIENDEIPY